MNMSWDDDDELEEESFQDGAGKAEASSSSHSASCCNCTPVSCISAIVVLLLFGAVFWGVRTPWGKLSIDFLPPAIRWDAKEPVPTASDRPPDAPE